MLYISNCTLPRHHPTQKGCIIMNNTPSQIMTEQHKIICSSHRTTGKAYPIYYTCHIALLHNMPSRGHRLMKPRRLFPPSNLPDSWRRYVSNLALQLSTPFPHSICLALPLPAASGHGKLVQSLFWRIYDGAWKGLHSDIQSFLLVSLGISIVQNHAKESWRCPLALGSETAVLTVRSFLASTL